MHKAVAQRTRWEARREQHAVGAGGDAEAGLRLALRASAQGCAHRLVGGHHPTDGRDATLAATAAAVAIPDALGIAVNHPHFYSERGRRASDNFLMRAKQ
jgi:hypothetical protein